MQRWFIAMCAVLGGSLACAQEAEEAHRPSPERTDPVGVESILVTGEQPGPPLWEVTDGGHSLWLLASYAPLPKGMAWRSKEVESIIAEAQEVLGPYGASFEVSEPESLRLQHSRLRKVLSHKAYARWRSLQKRYIPRDIQTETLLPASAAMLLRVSALEASGLVYTDDLWRRIYTLAHRYRVPISTQHQLTIPVADTARTASRTERQRIGVDYLVKTMDRLEEDLAAARERANAWAVGDIEQMRRQAAADGAYAFLNAQSWPFLQGGELEAALALTDQRWVDAADAALKRNATTFAVLPAYLIFQADGPLAALKEKGYAILEPVSEP